MLLYDTGMDPNIVGELVHSWNLTHCKPPKDLDEIDRILDWVVINRPKRG
jgi:hypothetical protein